MKVIAISSSFSHHGKDSGYKQILKFIKPVLVVGLNENAPFKPNKWLATYQFLYEFVAFFKKTKADVLHILYGENYFRFSAKLFTIPIVVTYHQPAAALKYELESGRLAGRISGYMHRLNRGRFRKVAAAIVTNPDQKEILRSYIPEEKIHVIPLGVHLDETNQLFTELNSSESKTNTPYAIVLGNWLRDWDLLGKVLDQMKDQCPEFKFILINKKLEKETKDILSVHSNLTVLGEIDRRSMLEYLYNAKVHFMPLSSAAGNNALIESLSMGCPVITSLDGAGVTQDGYEIVKHMGREPNFLVEEITSKKYELNREKYRLSCNAYAQQFGWDKIAERTKLVYKSVL